MAKEIESVQVVYETCECTKDKFLKIKHIAYITWYLGDLQKGEARVVLGTLCSRCGQWKEEGIGNKGIIEDF